MCLATVGHGDELSCLFLNFYRRKMVWLAASTNWLRKHPIKTFYWPTLHASDAWYWPRFSGDNHIELHVCIRYVNADWNKVRPTFSALNEEISAHDEYKGLLKEPFVGKNIICRSLIVLSDYDANHSARRVICRRTCILV